MMTEDIVQMGVRQVHEIRIINRDLTEKALRMRCLGYLSQVKARLLTETIIEIDQSKKNLLRINQKLIHQSETILRQKKTTGAKECRTGRSQGQGRGFRSFEIRLPGSHVARTAYAA